MLSSSQRRTRRAIRTLLAPSSRRRPSGMCPSPAPKRWRRRINHSAADVADAGRYGPSRNVLRAQIRGIAAFSRERLGHRRFWSRTSAQSCSRGCRRAAGFHRQLALVKPSKARVWTRKPDRAVGQPTWPICDGHIDDAAGDFTRAHLLHHGLSDENAARTLMAKIAVAGCASVTCRERFGDIGAGVVHQRCAAAARSANAARKATASVTSQTSAEARSPIAATAVSSSALPRPTNTTSAPASARAWAQPGLCPREAPVISARSAGEVEEIPPCVARLNDVNSAAAGFHAPASAIRRRSRQARRTSSVRTGRLHLAAFRFDFVDQRRAPTARRRSFARARDRVIERRQDALQCNRRHASAR